MEVLMEGLPLQMVQSDPSHEDEEESPTEKEELIAAAGRIWAWLILDGLFHGGFLDF